METMRSDLDRDEVAARAQERVTAQILRDLARHLHGDVQSRLFAAASEIDKANTEGDIDAMRDALQDAKEILANALPDEAVTKPSDLAENLEQLTALWRGLARVEYRISAPELLDPGSARALAAIAEEAVANAVRHGDASEVSIEIDHDASRSGWQIVVLDNGTGPTGGDSGLGTTLFTDLTDGNWSMQAEASSGTRLHAFVHAPVATHGPEPQGSRD
jgi:Signal transduction histidine kinase